MHALALALLLCGCGRIGFAPSGADDGAVIVDADESEVVVDFVAGACPPADLHLTGDATCESGAIVLTEKLFDQAGGVYRQTPVLLSPTSRMEVELVVRLVGMPPPASGDGMAFVIHVDPRGPDALGPGADLGYEGIVPSLVVELDTNFDMGANDPVPDHVGIGIDGDTDSRAKSPAGFALDTGELIYLWVDYDGPALRVDAYVATSPSKPSIPIVSLQLDDVVASNVWLGVVAGTFASQERHEVISFHVRIR